MAEVETSFISNWRQFFEDPPVSEITLRELFRLTGLAMDELLAYREGYDPQREPDLGQWAVIEPVVRDGDQPFVVAQWINTPDEAADGWVCDREPDAQVWFVRLGNVFNWWATSDVRRWRPLPGGER